MAAVAVMPYCYEPESGDFSEFCCREFEADVYQHLVATGICRDCRVPSNVGTAREAEEGGQEVRRGPPMLEKQRREEDQCQCTSTQCWLLACVARAQTKTRAGAGLHVRGGRNEACPFPPVPGGKFCQHCLCAAPGCTRKTRERSRFCGVAQCAGKGWQKQQGPLDYVNQHGFYKVDPTWPSGLQVAAKWS